MREVDVKVVELQPMRMLSFYGYGEQPEDLAVQNLQDWAKRHRIRLDPEKHRSFGFNNPCPSAGSTRYGYEIWLTMDDSMKAIEPEPEQDIRIVDYPGGLYAVARFADDAVGAEYPQYWNTLNIWREKSKYQEAQHQWLEEHTVTGQPIAMYLPIKE